MENNAYNQFKKGLDIPKDWVDTSWSNDAMASYETKNLRIWIDHPIASESELYSEEYGEYKRFAVVYSDEYKDDNPNNPHVDDVLLDTSNFNELVSYVKENK